MSKYSTYTEQEKDLKLKELDRELRSLLSPEEYSAFIKEQEKNMIKMTVSLPPDEYNKLVECSGENSRSWLKNDPTLKDRYKEIIQKEKDDYEFEKEFKDSFKEKSPILKFIAMIFYKIINLFGFLWLLCSLSNIYFIYQVYKVCKISGIQGIIETKWSLYIIAYIIIFAIVERIRFSLYRYTRNE